MGRISVAILSAALLASGAAAQDDFDIIAIEGGKYETKTPLEVVTGGLPSQAGESQMCLKTSGTALGWGECGSGGGGGEGSGQCKLVTQVSNETVEAYIADWAPTTPLIMNANYGAGNDFDRSWVFPAPPAGGSTRITVDSLGASLHVNRSSENKISFTTDGSHPFGDFAEWFIVAIECGSGGGGGGASLSDQLPQPLGTASAGTGEKASRDDHVHKRPTEIADNSAAILVNRASIAEKPGLSNAQPASVGSSAASGSASDASRGDHAHAFANYGTAIKQVGTASSPGILDQAARVDHVHKDSAGGGGGCTRCVSDPRAQGVNVGDVLTVAGVNAYGWAPAAPDLSEEVQDAEDDIADLDFITQDITAGIPAGQWADVSAATVAAIALFTNPATCDAAVGATWSTTISSGVAGKYHALRIPTATTELGTIAILITGDVGQEFREVASGHTALYKNNAVCKDNTYTYYSEGPGGAFTSSVTKVQMQSTGSAHIGTSKYAGDPLKVERWAIIGDTTQVPPAKTLPGLGGNEGRVLTVAEDAQSVQWSTRDATLSDTLPAAGGGSGYAGSSVYASRGDHSHPESITTEVVEQKLAAVEVPEDITFTQGAADSPIRFKRDAVSNNLSAYQRGNAQIVTSDSSDVIDNLVAIVPVGGSRFGWQIEATNSRCRFTKYYPVVDFRKVGGAPDGWNAFQLAVDIRVINFCRGIRGPHGWTVTMTKAAPLPTWFGDVEALQFSGTTPAIDSLSGTAGTSKAVARSDHSHPFSGHPAGSTDIPEADSANGSAGSSNKWSPSDHSHPITDHDSVTWTNAQVTTLTGGGASGGVRCDGSASYPTAAECKALVDNFRAGNYNFFILRVARFDDNNNNEPLHVSGCSLFPGIPSAIFDGSVVAQAACTANSAKNSANTFHQYDVFVEFGNTGNYVQVRLPNYNSYGVDDVTVTLTGVR